MAAPLVYDIVTSDDIAPHETVPTTQLTSQLESTHIDENKALAVPSVTTDTGITPSEIQNTNGALKGTPAKAEFKPILDLKHHEHASSTSSSDPESRRRASQVDWLKRESQIDPHDTASAQRERRPSKYPENPFLGDVNETQSHHDKHKKWKLTDGDFGFGMPKKPSNAGSQGFTEPGFRRASVASDLGGASGAAGPRGLFPNERGSIDKSVVSQHDKARKWSFRDADFGFGMPKKPSNASAQGFSEPGLRRPSVATGGGAEGPRGLADFEKGNIDQKVVSTREKSRKWSLAGGDFGFGAPSKKSNAAEQGLTEPTFRRPSVAQ